MGIVDGLVGRLNECMVTDSAACAKVRHKLSTCSACMDVCKNGAIRITSAGGKVLVDWDRCNACGQCAAVCPNRVFSMKLTDVGKLITNIKQQIAQDGECIISCRDDADTAHIRSLSFADRQLLVKTAVMGAGKITLRQGDCGKCSKDCLSIAKKEAEAANRIFELAQQPVRVVLDDPSEKRPTAADRLKNKGESISRREFFGFMRTKARRTIGETLYSLAENEKDRKRTVLSSDRDGLDSYISNLKYLGSDKLINRMRGEGLLMSVDINIDKCTRCGICARVCPMSVFTVSKDVVKGREITTAVTADADLCSGCGVCVTACMSDALKVHKL